ncbi:MAG: hypothetical protein COA78_37055 [Blastopirellula sp.]|nr:MAG: hypothetical protein COA78_37055 [Blastopirellula sp.]
MSLRIGNVDFGIDARTEGLQKALTKLKAFETQVNRVARAQTTGAQKATAAMTRQESTVKRAFQQTINLQQQLRKSGASAGEIAKVSNAFRLLTDKMTSGKITATQYTRSLDAFNARLGRSKRALKDLTATAAANQGSKLTQTLRNLESASVLAIGPLSGLGARIRSLGAIMNRSTLLLTAFVAGVTLAVVAIGKLSVGALRAGIAFERSFARFKAATPTLALASKEMLFVINTAQELGLQIDTSAAAFSRLTAASAGTVLQGKNTRDIFLGVSKAAAALRLSNVEVEGTFRAIEQMMSKGTVQAEELRGQLGERLPGAFNRAAAAMGVTTRALGEMLKKGEVTAAEFLPKFAKELERAFGKDAKDNVKSFGGSFNRLKNSTFLFGVELNNLVGFTDLVAGAFRILGESIDVIRTGMVGMTGIAAGLGEVMFNLSQGKSADVFNTMAKNINGAVGAMKELENSAAGAIDVVNSGLVEANPKLVKFRDQIIDMEKRLRAMNQGPAAVDFFERLVSPLDAFRRALVEAGISMEDGAVLARQYAQALKGIMAAEDAVTGAAQRSSNAIINGFEDAIFKANSFKDALKNIGLELIKIGLRAAIFDPLAKSLTNSLSGIGLPTISGAKAGGGPVGGGKSFLVGERGPEIFTPSTQGNITPNRNIGGGGINLTINAPGADAGTIATIRQMIVDEMVPQIIQQATRNTITQLKRTTTF